MVFLSCKANARVYGAKSGHGPHSPPPGAAALPKRLTKVAFATEPVWAQNPDSQSTKGISFTVSLCQLDTSLYQISQDCQPDFKIFSVTYSLVKVSVIEPSDAVKLRNS